MNAGVYNGENMMMTLNETQMQTLDKAVRECVDSLTRSDGEKEFRKDVASRMKEEFEISTSEFNNLVKERYNEDCSNKIEKLQAVVDLSDQLKNSSKT